MFRLVPKSKDGDPLERWRHFESKYAERVAPLLEGDEPTSVEKDEMVELASLRAKADRWRDRFFKGLEGVRD
jgi:hypothetical protein